MLSRNALSSASTCSSTISPRVTGTTGSRSGRWMSRKASRSCATPWTRTSFTCRFAVPLMVRRRRGLVVEESGTETGSSIAGSSYRSHQDVGDPPWLGNGRGIASPWHQRAHRHTRFHAYASHARCMRVTESNWRDDARKTELRSFRNPLVCGTRGRHARRQSECARKSGGLYSSWSLAREDGFTDVDGAQPDIGTHLGPLFDAVDQNRREMGYSVRGFRRFKGFRKEFKGFRGFKGFYETVRQAPDRNFGESS